MRRIPFDITGLSYDEFVFFLFGREVPQESFTTLAARGETAKWNPWYWNMEVTGDVGPVCDYYIRLFNRPTFLPERYSAEQLEQGFWAVQTLNLRCSAHSLIWNTDVPFEARADCIRAMYPLFRELFANRSLENSVCMWWDSFCYAWDCGNRKRSRGGEDLAMQDVMFETLVDILAVDSEICQGAALHGLSHLHHPSTQSAIESYLKRNPSLNDEWKKIALGVSRFDLM
ncbi:MAG TPA: hypothetical protein VJU82_11280 [Acidobacteriaceae bacterium]|nr:hypothetical protein [Acidobacteriaceae bacterium]